MSTRYIIAISEKGIMPRNSEEKSESMKLLSKSIPGLQNLTLGSWYLTQGGNEIYLTGTRSKEHPLESDDVDKIKKAFEKEKRNIKIFRLEEL